MSISRRLVIGLVIALGLALTGLSVAYAIATFPSFPPAFTSQQWLNYAKGRGVSSEASAYYLGLDSAFGDTTTFSKWKALYGFDGVNAETTAIYYNAGDLGFGREMHCRQIGADAACYVANHGFGPSSPVQLALDDAIGVRHDPAQPIVAMVYKDSLAGQPNAVSFYIYAPDGSRLSSVALDSEGPKFTPRLCLPCHGGVYNDITATVTAANFLPFDTASFRYSARPGYTLAAQQEKFRQLNALVRATNPTTATVQLIDGWYNNQVNTPNQPFNGDFIPPSFNNTATGQALYKEVIRPYCRACHIAQDVTKQLDSPTTPALMWAVVPSVVYAGFDMPDTQMTSHNFWNSPAPAALGKYLASQATSGFQLVTTFQDPVSPVCPSVSNCSLRGALAASPQVIVFANNGTFTLDPAQPELAIVGSVAILGNGPGNTIIRGNGQRVFYFSGGGQSVIQDLTIENGNGAGTGVVNSGTGGGIYLTGQFTTLYLNRSLVRNNTASVNGGGIAVDKGALLELNGSTVTGNGVAGGGGGGGIYNDDFGGVNATVVHLNNSTVSGNSATFGGGLYNTGPNAVINVFQSTVVANAATDGGGGFRNISDGHLTLQNSIVAGNTAGLYEADCRFTLSPYESLGHNLFVQVNNPNNNPPDNGCTLTTPTDISSAGSIEDVLNLNLTGELTGAPYHALVPSSPAIDAVPLGLSCSLPVYDQRGVARPAVQVWSAAPACDIGAREFVTAKVTTANDVVDPLDGLCSLREAVTAANTGLPSGAEGGECPGSPDVINLSVAGPYNLTLGELEVQAAVTLQGNNQIIQRTSVSAFRIFHVELGGNLNLSNATVQNGLVDVAPLLGAGVLVDAGGIANIHQSAILSNTAAAGADGAGIAVNQGTLNLANSTVAGNSAGRSGGGLVNNLGTVNLTSVTITGNTANTVANTDRLGGGGLSNFGVMTVTNSLVAGNIDTPNGSGAAPSPDVYSSTNLGVSLASGGYNVIGAADGSNSAFSNTTHDQTGAVGSLLNPKLGARTGSPAYYPLLGGSPATRAVPQAACLFISHLGNPLFRAGAPNQIDQNGGRRPVGGFCDIGAIQSSPFVYLPIITR